MRVKSICLSWFRGAADPVALEADGKSMVVYGQNGAGKSSFIDAVEYVINGGKLTHLAHEYSGRHQERGIPNTHTPDDRDTEFTIKFQNDAELYVNIARDGTHERVEDDGVSMESWDYQRTVLRQDEVAEFIRSRKGEKYSTLLPLFGLQSLEIAAENLRQLAKAVEQQSKLRQKQGAVGLIAHRRKQAFGDDSDEAIDNKITELHTKYCPKSKTSDALARRSELETALTERINALSAENQRYVAIRAIADVKLAAAIKAVRDANSKLAGSVEPLITEKLEVLQSADVLVEKLDDEGEVVCPACGRPIPAEKFKAHVKAEQVRLQEIIAVFNERRSAIGVLVDATKAIKTTVAMTDIKPWREETRKSPLKVSLEWIEQCNVDAFRQALSEDDLKKIEDHCTPIIDAANEASQDAPPDIKDLSSNKTLVEAAKLVAEATELAAEILRTEELIKFIDLVEANIREEIRERSESVISEISGDVGTMWETLNPGEPIDNIHLYLPEDDKAIDIALRFHGKDQESPRLTLSEGYRNSLGICIFLAMAKQEGGHDRPLFLDDVVVSLDRNHRGMIVQLLEEQFADRQVIVLTHDRDWYTELRQQLDEKRWGFKTLLPYETPTLGIRWSHKATTFDDARSQLKDRPDGAGNDARKIMDVELAIIAERLQLRLPYMRGEKNDRRTAHDFLTRIVADGKKSFQRKAGQEYVCDVDALKKLEEADRLLVSWGNRGAHSFDVVRPEAAKLIDACEQALEAFKCSECNRPLWFADVANGEWIQCQCSKLRWRYGKH